MPAKGNGREDYLIKVFDFEKVLEAGHGLALTDFEMRGKRFSGEQWFKGLY